MEFVRPADGWGDQHQRFQQQAKAGGVARWLERLSMTGKLSLACAMTCS